MILSTEAVNSRNSGICRHAKTRIKDKRIDLEHLGNYFLRECSNKQSVYGVRPVLILTCSGIGPNANPLSKATPPLMYRFMSSLERIENIFFAMYFGRK